VTTDDTLAGGTAGLEGYEETEMCDEIVDDLLLQRVRAERELRNLSVRQAARRTEVSNTTWQRWENEGGPPKPAMRKAVADAFGWDADWPENPPPIERSRHDPDVLEELRGMRQIMDVLVGEAKAGADDRAEMARTIAVGVRLLVEMEARQRRAFDLLQLDPTVDLDDSRLDDPTYRAQLRHPAAPPRARPTGRRRSVKNG
jgi:transcriptional regulator with XRE-family HTH domain